MTGYLRRRNTALSMATTKSYRHLHGRPGAAHARNDSQALVLCQPESALVRPYRATRCIARCALRCTPSSASKSTRPSAAESHRRECPPLPDEKPAKYGQLPLRAWGRCLHHAMDFGSRGFRCSEGERSVICGLTFVSAISPAANCFR